MISPGRKLRLLIEELGLDQIKVADTIGVTRQTINNIVNDRQPISRDMANRLARLTGRTPGYWLQSEFVEREGFAEEPREAWGGGAILVDHQIVRAIDDGAIGIDPFDIAQVQAASIDLRLGDLIIPAGGEPETIGAGKTFKLYPGQTVNVQTRETIRFPDNHIGRVGAITEVTRFGIIAAHGFQVDPNYQGHLQFCLFNGGNGRYELRSGAPIISLEITRLGATPSSGKIALERNRDEVQTKFGRAHASVALIRKWLAGFVETRPDNGRFAAKIPDLDVDLSAATEEEAIRSAVTTALAAFRSTCANPKLTEFRAPYQTFFVRHAHQLYLDHDATRNVAQALGLAVEGDVVILPNGRHLPLPQDAAAIGLDQIALRLGQSADELVFALTSSMKNEADDNVTPFRPRPD